MAYTHSFSQRVHVERKNTGCASLAKMMLEPHPVQRGHFAPSLSDELCCRPAYSGGRHCWRHHGATPTRSDGKAGAQDWVRSLVVLRFGARRRALLCVPCLTVSVVANGTTDTSQQPFSCRIRLRSAPTPGVGWLVVAPAQWRLGKGFHSLGRWTDGTRDARQRCEVAHLWEHAPSPVPRSRAIRRKPTSQLCGRDCCDSGPQSQLRIVSVWTSCRAPVDGGGGRSFPEPTEWHRG